jgi:hypothetical protein
MAHKLLPIIPQKDGKRKFSFPNISGRFGVSFFIGSKELFIGFMLSDVVLEQVTRRRVVKISKATTRTYGFDPFSSDSQS